MLKNGMGKEWPFGFGGAGRKKLIEMTSIRVGGKKENNCTSVIEGRRLIKRSGKNERDKSYGAVCVVIYQILKVLSCAYIYEEEIKRETETFRRVTIYIGSDSETGREMKKTEI